MSSEDLIKVSFLKCLNQQEREDLWRSSRLISFKEYEIIYRENSPPRSLPILIKGTVSIFLIKNQIDNQKYSNKNEVFLYHLTEGETCSVVVSNFLKNTQLSLRAEAATDCDVLFIPIEKFQRVLSYHPEIFEYLLESYYKVFTRILNFFSYFAFGKLEDRLLFLLKEKCSHSEGNNVEITHEELSRHLCTSREVVTRILHKLEQEKRVALFNGKIEILF